MAPRSGSLLAGSTTASNDHPLEHTMNKDQVRGRVKQAKGKIKEVAGRISGNRTSQAKGKLQSAAGKVQAGYGDVKADIKGAT